MTRILREDWLFTRGPQSVRVVRECCSNSSCRLVVYGPGTELLTYDFSGLAECMKRQSEVDLQLLGAGFHLARLRPDRRAGHGNWSGPDHRRVPD